MNQYVRPPCYVLHITAQDFLDQAQHAAATEGGVLGYVEAFQTNVTSDHLPIACSSTIHAMWLAPQAVMPLLHAIRIEVDTIPVTREEAIYAAFSSRTAQAVALVIAALQDVGVTVERGQLLTAGLYGDLGMITSSHSWWRIVRPDPHDSTTWHLLPHGEQPV